MAFLRFGCSLMDKWKLIKYMIFLVLLFMGLKEPGLPNSKTEIFTLLKLQ
jgi:hypothetical protein